MTYKTFILTRNLVLALLVAVGCFALFRGCTAVLEAGQRSRPMPVASGDFPRTFNTPEGRITIGIPRQPSGSTRRITAAQGSAPDRQPVDSLHKEVLEMAKKPITNGESSGNSRKWRVKRGRLVIELRSDTSKGSTTWNRAKIDLNGNKQFDEAWDFKNGEVKRRVAPSDDENYSVTYDLRGSTWVKRAR